MANPWERDWGGTTSSDQDGAPAQGGPWNRDWDSSAPEPKPTDEGDFHRGWDVAWGQLKPLAQGATGLVGATMEKTLGAGGVSTSIKNWGLNGYQTGMQALQPLQKDTDELTTAWKKAKEGDWGALVDWAQYGIGYNLGQLSQAATTAAAGAVIGTVATAGNPAGTAAGAIGGAVEQGATRALAARVLEPLVQREIAKIAAEQAAKNLSEQAVRSLAVKAVARDIGALGAVAAYTGVQEAGSIYPDAEAEAKKQGRELDGADLARVWAGTAGATAIESLTDTLGLGAITGRIRVPGVGGRVARAATGAAIGSAAGGATEAAQTVLERWGAGQEIGSPEGIKDIINSAGLGALGGAGPGAIGGALHGPAQTPAPAPVQPQVGDLRTAVDQYLQNTGPRAEDVVATIGEATTVDEAISVASQATDSLSDIAERKQGAYLAPLMDRQADLAQQAATAPTEFERTMAADQAATSLAQNLPGRPASDYVNLHPMDERTANGALRAEREMTANAGGNALELEVVPHPSIPGKFAIARTAQVPSLDLPGPSATEQRSAEVAQQGAAQNKIESAALAGTQTARVSTPEEQGRQALITRTMQAIEQRGGVASPEEARVLQEAGLGQPYDRVDPALSTRQAALTTDQKLTQATGIALDKAPRPRAEAQTGRTELAQATTENNARSDSRMQRLAAEREAAQNAKDAANLATQQQASERPAPNVDALTSILKKSPALRNAQEQTILNDARQTLTPEQFSIIERAAVNPPSLSATERLQLRRMREGDIKFSQPREEQSEKRDVATPRMESESSEVSQQGDTESKGTALPYRHEESKLEEGAGSMEPRQHALVRQLARIFGKKIQVFSSEREDAPDGYVRKGDDRTIYLNSKSQQSHLVVFGHELLHQLKRNNPAAYETLAKVIKLKEGVDISEVSGIEGDMEEFTADLMGNRFAEPQFWIEVFNQLQDKPAAVKLGETISRVVKQFINVLKGMRGFDTDKAVANLQEVRDAARDALAQYARSQYKEAQAVDREANSPIANSENAEAVSPGSNKAPVQPQSNTEPKVTVKPDLSTRRKLAVEAARRDMGLKFAEKREAYHGTPHRGIDRFSTEKIGTGEGAQAYGWGLYFAGHKSIAEFYRKQLQGGPLGVHITDAMNRALGVTYSDATSAADLIDTVQSALGEGPEAVRAAIIRAADKMSRSPHDATRARGERVRELASNDKLVEAVDREARGQLYTVHVPHDDEMLDYDARLSEQPAKVKEALASLGFPDKVYMIEGPGVELKGPVANGFATLGEAQRRITRDNLNAKPVQRPSPLTGKDAYKELSKRLGGDKAASELLAEVGVPGLRYLDAGSRGVQAKRDTRNYVVFQDKDVEITGALYSRKRDTPEFKKWFGDSKVVDEQGKPLVVYHGSPADIEAFDPAKSPVGNKGMYFTTDTLLAETYARREGAMYPVYLSIKNPLILDGYSLPEKGIKVRIARLLFPKKYKEALAKQQLKDNLTDKDAGRYFTQSDVDALRAAGYDGVITMNAYPGGNLQALVVFEPTQIKSAIGNNGDFDARNPDITKSAKRDDLFPGDFASKRTTVPTSRVVSSTGETAKGGNVNSAGNRIAATKQGLENFWKWFGDSETVDDKGRPEVYYHTTRNDFNKFEANRVTRNSGTFGEWETSRAAMFFTTSVKDSEAYGTQDNKFVGGANVMPVYLRAENILDLTSGYLPSYDRDAARIEEAGLSPRYFERFDWSAFDDEDGREMVAGLKRAGYDAVKFWDQNPDTEKSFTALAVFDSEQIKSAIGNRETFDARTPDITKSAKRGQLDNVEAYHYSQAPRKVLSSSYFGTGLKGSAREEYQNASDERRRQRISFYVDKGTGVRPESGVGGYPHRAYLSNIYDANADPLGLRKGGQAAFESAVLDQGFDGYLDRLEGSQPGQVIMLGKRTVPVEALKPGPIKSGQKVEPLEQKAPEWQTQSSGPEAAMQAKAERMRGQAAWKDYDVRVTPDSAGFARVETRQKQAAPATLNVGLSTAEVEGSGQITPQRVRQALEDLGVPVEKLTVHESDTEPTAVVELGRALTPVEANHLSVELKQEAIAQRNADGTGELFGPKAQEWGPYNPSYFLMPDGKRAAEELAASKKREQLDPEIVQTLGKHIRNLTPDERAKLRRDTAQKLVDTIKKLPSANEMAAVAYAGRAKRGWYYNSAKAIEHVFGGDGPRFAALLAALSPQCSVETNLLNALNTYKNWVAAGRPTTREEIIDVMAQSVQGGHGRASVLGAWINNSVRALSAEDPSKITLSGPKVNSFMKNLVGVTEEVTNDAWMSNYALVEQTMFSGSMTKTPGDPGKRPGYVAMSARVREAAKKLTQLTGEEWTPAEVQETIWSWAKTLYETASVNKSAEEIVLDKGITDEMLRSTPDFRTLFHDDVNEQLLREAGLGDRVATLRERSDLGYASDEESGAQGQAAPFDSATQEGYEVRAARRLDELRERSLKGGDIQESAKRTGNAAQEDADTIYRELAADEEMTAALEVYMTRGDAPEGALNDKLVAYMRRFPPVPADSYLTFYRNQPIGARPWGRGWASWTINKDQTRYFGGKNFEILERKGGQGISLEELGQWRTRLTGEYHQYGSQGEWLLLNDSVFNEDANDPSITSSVKRIFDDQGRNYTDEQRAAFERVGRVVETPTLRERIAELKKDAAKKIAQGLVDQFRPLRDLSSKAYNLARLSKGSSGAVEAFLKHGQLKIVDGVYDADQSGGVVERVFAPLQGEGTDFLWWIAANRAERLTTEERENLFSGADIEALKSLENGTTSFDYTLQDGRVTRDRTLIYRDALKVLNEFNRNAMDMAEQSGLIDGDARKIWEHEFYVPFYRQSEEGGGVAGVKSGLVRQQAFKSLKGGADALRSDLLSNALLNWSHLIDAAAKNRAAKASVEAAVALGIAAPVENGTKGAVWVMDRGEKKSYLVDDPYVMTAISSLEYAGLKGGMWDALTKFKHWLTVGVTASPAFKIRNLVRDSVQAISVAPLGANPLTNIARGIRESNPETQTYVSALASGGLIRFGTMLEGREADRVRQLVKTGIKDSTILDNESKLRAFYDKVIEPTIGAYNELGNRSEEINRAALFAQLREQGVELDEAALAARDLMDFSMQGTWQWVRVLTQVVPFMNARLQGLYKLGRGAAEDPKRFAAVLGSVALASIALMAAYSDDDDWKKREDWDRNNFWWFKMGGVAWRIPKPFEIGAIATLAERGIELFTNKDMTSARFAKNVRDLLSDNLSMNPIPQAVKPLLDLYANKDSFTGRPIETMGMERLQPDYRFAASTSMPARAISTAGQAVASAAGGNFLSPVQIDHVLRGYFGWLGSFVVGGADMAVRPLTSEPTRPAADYWKLATQGIAAETTSGSSYYVSALYDQAKVLEEAYGTWTALIKQGKVAEAREFYEGNKDRINRYKVVERVKSEEAKYNELIRMIERSNIDPEVKKARIIEIRAKQDKLARIVTEAR